MGLALLAATAIAVAVRALSRERRMRRLLRVQSHDLAEAERVWSARHRAARQRGHAEAAELAASTLCTIVQARQEIETWDRT